MKLKLRRAPLLSHAEAIEKALSLAGNLLSASDPEELTAEELRLTEFVSLAALVGVLQGFMCAKGDFNLPNLAPYQDEFREAFSQRFRPPASSGAG